MSLQKLVHDYGAVAKLTGFVTFGRFRIGVNVMQPSLGLESRVTRGDERTLDVYPAPEIIWIRDRLAGMRYRIVPGHIVPDGCADSIVKNSTRNRQGATLLRELAR
jgi:hypothetical protein